VLWKNFLLFAHRISTGKEYIGESRKKKKRKHFSKLSSDRLLYTAYLRRIPLARGAVSSSRPREQFLCKRGSAALFLHTRSSARSHHRTLQPRAQQKLNSIISPRPFVSDDTKTTGKEIPAT